MLKRFGNPLLIAFGCVVITACGGGGGGAVPPSQGTTGPQTSAPPLGVAISQTTKTVSPSRSVGGAHSVQFTEYKFARLQSNSGGLAIAHDGSVWIVGTDYTNNPGFLRFANGGASWYGIPPLNEVNAIAAARDMAATGSEVYGLIGNIFTDTGLPAGNELWSASVVGGSLNIAEVWPIVDTPDPGNFCCIFGTQNEAWVAVGYQQSPSALNNLPQTTNIPLPSGVQPRALAQGPDKNIWAGVDASEFLVYSSNGTLLHTFPVVSAPTDAVAGPDGALWFLVQPSNTYEIGRITTSGTTTYYKLNSAFVATITVGSDGALWFTEVDTNKIGRITTSGQLTEYTIPTPNSQPWQIVGPGSGCAAFTLWFAEQGSDKIAMVRYQ